MYKIKFNYRYGKDRVFCSDYKVDNYFVYPLNKEGKPMCTISRTNIISITKDNKMTIDELKQTVILCACNAPDGEKPEIIFDPMPFYEAIAQYVVSKSQLESCDCHFAFFISLDGEILMQKRIN